MDFPHLTRMLSSYWLSRSLMTSVELDLFTHIDRGCSTRETLSTTAGISMRGLNSLLPVLFSLDLVEDTLDGLSLTPLGELLSTSNPMHRLGVFWHHINLWKKWDHLTRCVITGEPVEGDLDLESFILAMAHGKTEQADDYFGSLDLADVNRVLDLGGGPGSFSLEFLERIPEATVVLFDMPEVIEIAKRILPEQIGKTGRLELLPGDFRKDPIGKKYDMIWVSSIIHSYGDEDCLLLAEKCYRSLNPGGRIVVRDFFIGPEEAPPLFPALFSLNMLVNTPHGKTYGLGEFRDILEKAGFGRIETIDSAGDSRMVIGYKL